MKKLKTRKAIERAKKKMSSYSRSQRAEFEEYALKLVYSHPKKK